MKLSITLSKVGNAMSITNLTNVIHITSITKPYSTVNRYEYEYIPILAPFGILGNELYFIIPKLSPTNADRDTKNKSSSFQ